MQDIAGCRVVVGNVVEQERFVASLITDFPKSSVIDRRNNPSYGYRAVHIIAEISGKPIEIQVRTSLQHLWAEVSEKSSDVLDPTIKYGGGSESWRNFLTGGSKSVAAYEELEKTMAAALEVYMDAVEEEAERFLDEKGKEQSREKLRVFKENEERELVDARNTIADFLTEAISWLDELKRRKQ